MEPTGAYTADRAAALSGVPKSTLHYWARHNVLVPSLSPERVKLWSFSDLMGLRTIYWLRQPKGDPRSGTEIPASTMPAVRRALKRLSELDVALWSEERGPGVSVSRSGEVFTVTERGTEADHRRRVLDGDYLDLIAPFQTASTAGPDLHKPRPHLRIVPGKLAGSPHIFETRIETVAIAALADRSFPAARINTLYPDVDQAAILEAIDLENQLRRNLLAAAA
jgi:uncharacterized protein (DUF433 family)